MNKAVQGLLGLARRAGYLNFGRQALTGQNAPKIALILMANDVSQRTKNDVLAYAEKYAKTLIISETITELSLASSAHQVGVLVITERGLATQIKQKMKEGDPYGPEEEKILPLKKE